jgi:ribosomal protein S18 acetylase RimI-like enzyme
LDGGKNYEKHCACPATILYDAITKDTIDNVKAIYLNNKLIGIVHFYIIRFIKNKKTENKVWINRLLIHKTYQNKGYGKKVFEKLQKMLVNKYSIKRIEVSVSNPILLKVLEKYGFKKLNTKRGKNHYQKHKEYIFVLDL